MSGGFLYVDDSFLRISLESLTADLDFLVTVRIPLKLQMPYHCGCHVEITNAPQRIRVRLRGTDGSQDYGVIGSNARGLFH
jgi:hypothetical protein